MKVIGKSHSHDLDDPDKYEAGVVVECKCGKRFRNYKSLIESSFMGGYTSSGWLPYHGIVEG